jgi:hypothetical protein
VAEKSISLQVYGTFKCRSILFQLIEKVKLGFLEGLNPILIPDGTSGTYKLRDSVRDTVALFKPIDEEAFAPNNQKGYTGKFGQESFRKGILSGEGSIREVVAYLLDRNNYFKVPETTFVEICHPCFNNKNNDLMKIEENNLTNLRNSIIHNFVLENLVSTISTLEINDDDLNFINKEKDKKNCDDTNSVNNIINSNKIVLDNNNKDKDNYNCNIKDNYKDNFFRKNATKKYGSFQKFIISDDIAANYSWSLFNT